MIKTITVYNRFHMDTVAGNLSQIPSKYWHLISISGLNNILINDKTKSSFESQGCHKILALQFDDISPNVFAKCLEADKKVTLFSKDQAKQIVEFIGVVQEETEPSDLVIHCEAGISRSGAVARFTSDFLKIPFDDKHIHPNSYVLRTLWEVVDEQKAIERFKNFISV